MLCIGGCFCTPQLARMGEFISTISDRIWDNLASMHYYKYLEILKFHAHL